ncbi:MAG: carboxypeptidase-like regulatory domain-containing protein [Candidatus Omnitrophota bacterium]|nr:carboxypeptidase-like regulatory domain-containing protein [Candidatus Omnitrophota bacterium]
MLKKIQLILGIAVGVVTLAVGAYNAKKIFFSPQGPGAVSIQVRADGRAVPQAWVQISKVQGGIIATSETGADGGYSKKGLEPGNYSLQVSKGGLQPEKLFFTVEPGQTAELNLALEALPNSIRSALEEAGASWIKKKASE